jgi:type IV pilus assembly protein PilW
MAVETAKRQRQRGVTLVELLVAMLVSLVLMAGIVEIFLSNKRTYRLQEALARVQEDGRFAVEALNRDIRLGGYPQNALPPVAAFPNPASTSVTAAPTRANWEADPDHLVVQYESYDVDPTSGVVGVRDCLGRIIAPGNQVVNWYSIDADGTAPDGLACVGSGAPGDAPQVLVEGVTDLQVTYGVDVDVASAPLDGSPNRYFTANAVPDWSRVLAVRVQLTVRSGVDDDAGNPLTRNFITTIPVRNNIP